MLRNRVCIIGISPEGTSCLSRRSRRLINNAGLVFAGRRLLDMFPSLTGEKVAIADNLEQITAAIKPNLGRKRMVVLASGDPGLYGIAGYLINKLGKQVIEIIPAASSMQVAFARIGESWEDAALTSVHARPIEDIIPIVASNCKTGIFTDAANNPARIAGLLLEYGLDDYQGYVCEDLGCENERITSACLHDLCKMKFSSLNVLILIKTGFNQAKLPAFQPRFGIPDAEFHQRKPDAGMITKLEVRAVSLSKLQLSPEGILWDIGAGSGAVSIEASFLMIKGRVYAVEKNAADAVIIRKNIRKFHALNIKVVHACAPDQLDLLPAPSSAFIGGSGGRMEDILNCVSRRLKPNGRIVINAVTLENLNTAVAALKTRGFTADVTLVNISRSSGIKELTRFQALNPVFVVAGARVIDKTGRERS